MIEDKTSRIGPRLTLASVPPVLSSTALAEGQIERDARAIFDATVDKSLWNLTWETAPPHHRAACRMQARAKAAICAAPTPTGH